MASRLKTSLYTEEEAKQGLRAGVSRLQHKVPKHRGVEQHGLLEHNCRPVVLGNEVSQASLQREFDLRAVDGLEQGQAVMSKLLVEIRHAVGCDKQTVSATATPVQVSNTSKFQLVVIKEIGGLDDSHGVLRLLFATPLEAQFLGVGVEALIDFKLDPDSLDVDQISRQPNDVVLSDRTAEVKQVPVEVGRLLASVVHELDKLGSPACERACALAFSLIRHSNSRSDGIPDRRWCRSD
jgi:hypothetical protein